MQCEFFSMVGGGTGVMCGSLRGRVNLTTCIACTDQGKFLCDGPPAQGRTTCSAPICGEHRYPVPIAKNRDLCPGCREEAHVRILPASTRHDRWVSVFGDGPVRVVSKVPSDFKGEMVFRVFVHRLSLVVYPRLVQHMTEKHRAPFAAMDTWLQRGGAISIPANDVELVV